MRNAEFGIRNRIVGTTIIFVLISVVCAFAAQDQQIEKKLAVLEALNGKFSFVVFGDNRSDKAVYKKLAIMAMALKPDFIVNTGDLIETPGDQKQWRSFWSMSKMIDTNQQGR